jgi:general secretion pathway protein C
MRRTLELHRALSVANLFLLAVLAYILLSLVLGGDAGQGPAVDTTPGITTTDRDIEKTTQPPANHSVILQRNIFGSTQVDATGKGPQSDNLTAMSSSSILEEQLQLRLLGTVAGNEEAACAVIEDLTTKVQDLYVIGDCLRGARIERIERNRIVLLAEDGQQVLNLYVTSGDSEPAERVEKPVVAKVPSDQEVVKIVSPSEREINRKAFLAKVGGMEAILRTVEVSPYVVNNEAKGLRISGLEGLSLAKYIGLRDGDVIQAINGQMVTDKRKAFQVLRKARALSSSDIQLLRGKEAKTLSFRIE